MKFKPSKAPVVEKAQLALPIYPISSGGLTAPYFTQSIESVKLSIYILYYKSKFYIGF